MIDTNKRVGDNSICSKQKNQSVKQIHEGSRKVDTQCIDCHVDAKQQQHTDLPWTCRLCQQSNLALRILFILTLWLMLFPMAYGPPWERCISVYIYIYIFIKVGLAQHAWTMAACKTSTMSIWVAKSLYLTGSWSLIDCNVVSFGGFKLIKKHIIQVDPLWVLFKTPWLEGNLKALKSTSHQYPLICWQHSNLWCQVSGMSQIFKHPKLNGVLTAWDGTGCMA